MMEAYSLPFDWKEVFSLQTANDFNRLAMEVFYFQSIHNPIYSEYLRRIKIKPQQVDAIEKIPFLPIEFFKGYKVLIGSAYQKIFESSGTTSQQTSKHYIKDLNVYKESFVEQFELCFPDFRNYNIVALLPSYSERNNSSLVYMVNHLMELSGSDLNDFYLYNYEELNEKLDSFCNENKKVLLFGVSFALLEFASQSKATYPELTIIETGGMKGRGKEITRSELHQVLSEKLKVKQIFSEYGMTELLSQAYCKKDEIFYPPKWMKMFIRDAYDPFDRLEFGATGGINVMDLANVYSCSFIETGDLGKVYADGSFNLLGRLDSSDIRGCNLMF